MHYIWMIVKT